MNLFEDEEHGWKALRRERILAQRQKEDEQRRARDAIWRKQKEQHFSQWLNQARENFLSYPEWFKKNLPAEVPSFDREMILKYPHMADALHKQIHKAGKIITIQKSAVIEKAPEIQPTGIIDLTKEDGL
jgi:hypothetical protein